MANVGLVTLGSLRLQAQQRSDMVGSTFITTAEWNNYLNNSYKELYDLLITSYGDSYFVASPYTFLTSASTNLCALPDGLTTTDSVTGLKAAAFYKLIGMEVQTDSVSGSWATMPRCEFTERNNFWPAYQYVGSSPFVTPYMIVGSNLWLALIPTPVQTLRMWYIPEPTNLQANLSCGTTSSSTTVTLADTSQLSTGMSVYGTGIPTGATISSISANVSVTISAAATATGTVVLSFWSDATTFSGISGWEEYIIVDAAIKALIKEESDISGLMMQKEHLKVRIQDAAPNRDASLPSRVSDTQSINLGWMGNGGWAWGGGG